VRKLLLCTALLALTLSAGCGGGSSSSGNNPPPPPPPLTPVNISGQYEVLVVSSSVPTAASLVEVNFTQTGTDVFAAKPSVLMIQGTIDGGMITLNGPGGQCDNGVAGNDSIQGTFSSKTQASLSFSEAGELGTVTATGSVTFSPDGSIITSGTYSIPAACGYLADTGTITGGKIQPFSGAYAGMLNGSDAVIVTITQSGLNLTITGTDNGAAFTLTGSVIGATFEVSGTFEGQPVQLNGMYDQMNNTFLAFDSQLNYLGTLKAGTNPQAITASTARFKIKH
jgi:hypothetical protein